MKEKCKVNIISQKKSWRVNELSVCLYFMMDTKKIHNSTENVQKIMII